MTAHVRGNFHFDRQIDMTHRRLSEVIGFDEFEGRLRVRLRGGSVPVLDKDGRPVVVRDPLCRKQLCLGAAEAPLSPADPEDLWDPWRQGP
jgi:hypothetical protein